MKLIKIQFLEVPINNKLLINIVGMFLLVVSVCYSFYTVDTFKLFYRDSIWVASHAYNFVKAGTLVDVLAREVGLALGHGRVHDILYGNIMILFDDIIFSHRYLSWFISVLSLYTYFLLSIRLGYGKQVALYSTLFLSITEHFLLSAHIARTDILAFLIVLVILYLMVKDAPALISSLFAGLLAAIALDVHLSTQYVFLMLLGYEISKGKLTASFFRNLIFRYRYFIVGYVLGFTIVAFNNFNHYDVIVEGFDLLKEKAINVNFIDRISWFFTFPFSNGFRSTYLRWLFYPALTVLVVYLYFTSSNRNVSINQSFVIFISGFIGFLVLGRMSHHYIMLFVVFLYQILVFKSLEEKNIIARTFTVLSVVMFVGIQVYVVVRDGGNNIVKYHEKIRGALLVEDEVVVIAPDDLWFVFRDNIFHGYHTRGNIEDIKNTNKVLFISNEIHNRFIVDGTILGKSTGVGRFDKEYLKGFTKVTEITDKHYGGFGMTKDNHISFHVNY